MDGWIYLAIAVALVIAGAVANRLGWIDFSNKNRSSGSFGGAFGGIDEVFHPTKHEAQLIIEREAVLPAPAPTPGDGDKGVYDGRVRIDLDGRSD